ncbi:radical SAM protein [Geothrix alkalitolerans]|uniref:radical SAM protein n=1 Tax=Geothrix alkalitolerans TaxID=2922724 RepID=UPI001FAF8EE6|nr:radical SAM protein [Geothrix alkalitolerans]
MFSMNDRVVLNPAYLMKNDVDRVALLNRVVPHASYVLISPSEAILFALMDGFRSIREVGRVWAELTGRTEDAGVEEVLSMANAYRQKSWKTREILIPADAVSLRDLKGYSFEKFIIAKDKVNLTERRLRKPHHVTYLPTMFCPHKCVYCYAKVSRTIEENLLSLGRLEAIFKEFSDLEFEFVRICGGEALLHPRIFDILGLLNRFGMTASIPTKMGISVEQARKLRDLGIQLELSVDSADASMLDRMIGVKNHHRSIFRSLEATREAGISVVVNCVVIPENVPHLGGLIDFLGGLGHVRRLSLTPYGRSMGCHSDSLFISDRDAAEIGEAVELRRARYPTMEIVAVDIGHEVPSEPASHQEAWEYRGYCTGNRDGFVLLPDGKVTVCEELYDHPAFLIGDLSRQSVMEMWNSKEAWSLIYPDQGAVPDGPCRTCGTFRECNSVRGRCWRDIVKVYGGDKPHYPDLKCPKAPATSNRLR